MNQTNDLLDFHDCCSHWIWAIIKEEHGYASILLPLHVETNHLCIYSTHIMPTEGITDNIIEYCWKNNKVAIKAKSNAIFLFLLGNLSHMTSSSFNLNIQMSSYEVEVIKSSNYPSFYILQDLPRTFIPSVCRDSYVNWYFFQSVPYTSATCVSRNLYNRFSKRTWKSWQETGPSQDSWLNPPCNCPFTSLRRPKNWTLPGY